MPDSSIDQTLVSAKDGLQPVLGATLASLKEPVAKVISTWSTLKTALQGMSEYPEPDGLSNDITWALTGEGRESFVSRYDERLREIQVPKQASEILPSFKASSEAKDLFQQRSKAFDSLATHSEAWKSVDTKVKDIGMPDFAQISTLGKEHSRALTTLDRTMATVTGKIKRMQKEGGGSDTKQSSVVFSATYHIRENDKNPLNDLHDEITEAEKEVSRLISELKLTPEGNGERDASNATTTDPPAVAHIKNTLSYLEDEIAQGSLTENTVKEVDTALNSVYILGQNVNALASELETYADLWTKLAQTILAVSVPDET